MQGLDGEAHHHRKQMFMSLMTLENVGRLTDIFQKHLKTYAEKWAHMEQVRLYDAMQEILCRSVCEWAGVPLKESEVERRTNELSALYGYAGSVGPKHWWARIARRLSNQWAEAHIKRVRSSPNPREEGAAAYEIALHRDPDGNLLEPDVAAVELVNILRPTVAVSVYIAFVAHALYHHPEARERLNADDAYLEHFVQEVRRMYPFFPAVVGEVRQDFEHKGCPFHKGDRVMLDLYGINHDPRIWEAPDTFNPDRFSGWEEDLFAFVPQGGGDPHMTHRCPGEKIAVELMKTAARFLTSDITYDVPPQDMRIDKSQLPALPRSHFVISHVS